MAELSDFAMSCAGYKTNVPVLQASITNFSNTRAWAFRVYWSNCARPLIRTPAIHTSVTNFAAFTRRLHASAGELEVLIATNAPTVQSALSNIEAFSLKFDKTTAIDLHYAGQ